MEIEIVTTKKKLTKSLVRQMREIKLSEMDTANVLGFVNDNPVLIILEIDRFEYRKIHWHWYRGGESSIYCKVGKYTLQNTFKTGDEADKYILKLNEFRNEAVQIYI